MPNIQGSLDQDAKHVGLVLVTKLVVGVGHNHHVLGVVSHVY